MSAAAIDLVTVKKTIRVGFLGRARTLLEDVTLKVDAGTTVGFIGGNGAGKSTTIKHLIGALRPTSGTVRILGGDPHDAAVRRRLGYMPEIPALPPTLTARELLNLHAVLCGVTRRAERTKRLLELVDLEANADRRVGGFSKGMQTRLSLALALVHEPELLILDEPMSGLDPVGRSLVRQILHDEGARGCTVFFSSHVLADVEALCDRVAVIRAGRLVAFVKTSEAVGAAVAQWRIRLHMKDGAAPAGVKEAKKEGDTWLVVVDNPDGVAAAAALQDAGAIVLGLEPLRATLEERTISLLGGAA